MDHSSDKRDEIMKKSLVMSIAMLMILGPILFFATGCAKQSQLAGTDRHTEVPKAEHERRFPHGHKQTPGSHGETCVYNEKTEKYTCEFDWFE
jgi:hypothetical protein